MCMCVCVCVCLCVCLYSSSKLHVLYIHTRGLCGSSFLRETCTYTHLSLFHLAAATQSYVTRRDVTYHLIGDEGEGGGGGRGCSLERGRLLGGSKR